MPVSRVPSRLADCGDANGAYSLCKVHSSDDRTSELKESLVPTDGDSKVAAHEISGGSVKQEKVGGLILKVLTDADNPLQVEEIVEHIQNKVDHSAETEVLNSWVTRELQSDISTCVERDGSSHWSIKTESRSKTDELSNDQKEGTPDGESPPFQSQFSKTQDGVYRGPEDLDESKFLSVLHSIDPSVQGYVAAEIQRSGDPIKSALDRSEYKLGQKHARHVERGGLGAKSEKVVELVREAAGEIEGPIEEVFVGRRDDREGQTENRIGESRPAETLSFLQKAILGVGPPPIWWTFPHFRNQPR